MGLIFFSFTSKIVRNNKYFTLVKIFKSSYNWYINVENNKNFITLRNYKYKNEKHLCNGTIR